MPQKGHRGDDRAPISEQAARLLALAVDHTFSFTAIPFHPFHRSQQHFIESHHVPFRPPIASSCFTAFPLQYSTPLYHDNISRTVANPEYTCTQNIHLYFYNDSVQRYSNTDTTLYYSLRITVNINKTICHSTTCHIHSCYSNGKKSRIFHAIISCGTV